jgi:hypothetical protein
MQNTSTAWKLAQAQTFVPESFVEITYTINDPEAQADATAADNGSVEFSNIGQTLDGLDKDYRKYATLELNSWLLDGSIDVLPETVTQDTGFVSSVLSNEDCVFAFKPTITISFSTVHEPLIPGVTIRWSEAFDECAREFTVTAYNGVSVVATKTVTGNTSNLSVVEMDISNYNKIVIEIAEWCLPMHRARIEEILVGVIKIFGKSDLMGYEHSQYVDLLSADCPKAEVVFSIRNETEAWNPDNPEGIWKYLLERQEIKVRYGYKIDGAIEWIKAGTFYMSEWTTPSNGIVASFTARDLLEFMQGEFSTSSTTLTLYDLAEQALLLADLPLQDDGSVRWIIDSSLSAITVTLPSDFDYTIAEVLQLCANAACCVFYQDREGIIRIEPLANILTDYVIDQSISYANAEYDISKELKSVDVNKGLGTATNNAKGEVQTVDNPLIQNSTVANAVAAWVKDCLKNRKTLSGEYRSDPRLDALDKITVSNKFATNTVFVTSINYSYGGAFKGEYEGRVVA